MEKAHVVIVRVSSLPSFRYRHSSSPSVVRLLHSDSPLLLSALALRFYLPLLLSTLTLHSCLLLLF